MSRLQDLVAAIPSEHRCIQSSPGAWNLPLNSCYFGVPQSEDFGWTTLEQLPDDLTHCHFFLGGEPVELLQEFAQSPFPRRLKTLAIGNSCYSIGKGLDYSQLITAISQTEFPELQSLHLGVWELFSNSHCMYGKLGDVTNLIRNCPKLVQLGLYGSFNLTQQLTFANLIDLHIQLEDPTTASNGGFINQQTLNSILSSEYPQLREVFLDLECEDDDYGYQIPSGFQPQESMPKLKAYELAGGFTNGSIQLVRQAFKHQPDLQLHVEEMMES